MCSLRGGSADLGLKNSLLLFRGGKKNHKDNLSDKAVKHNALFGNDANLLIHLTGKVNAPGLAKRLFFICNLHD